MKKIIISILLMSAACTTAPITKEAPKLTPEAQAVVNKTGHMAATLLTPKGSPITSCGDVYGDVYLTADLSTSSGDCLKPKVNGVTIDGNGHSIMASGFAVNVMQKNHVTIKNVKGGGSIQVYGGSSGESDYTTIQDSELGWIGAYDAAYQVISNNKLTGYQNGFLSHSQVSLHNTFTHNTVVGGGTRFVDFGGNWGDSTHPCPWTYDAITNNRITNSVDVITDNPLTLYYRCGRGAKIYGNSIQAVGEPSGLILRDGASDNTIEGNVIFTDLALDGARGSLQFITGNEGVDFKGYPSRNTVKDNFIFSSLGTGVWMQAPGDKNIFIYNRVYSFNRECFYINAGDGNTFSGNVLNCATPVVWGSKGTNTQWNQ